MKSTVLSIDLEALGLYEREVLMAFALGMRRVQARANELTHCTQCADNAARYLRAGEILNKLIAHITEERNHVKPD